MGFDVKALLDELPQRINEIPLRWAAAAPNALALSQGDIQWTWCVLVEAIEEAVALLRGLEVRAGDRVMIVSENCLAQIALIFAVAKIDAWSVSVNARLSPREIDSIRAHSQSRRLIYTDEISAEAGQHATRHGAVSLVTKLLGGLAVGPLNEECQPEPVITSGAEQVAALVYTTGTTGHPKAVMLTHRNLLFIAAVSSKMRRLSPTDRVYGVLPISHVYGLASVTLGTLYSGASLHVVPRYLPEFVVDSLARHGITVLQGVPAMYGRLLEFARRSGGVINNKLRFLYAGGSPLDPTLKEEVEAFFGQPLHNGYGMTESSPTISQTNIEAPRKDTSVGFAIPGIEIRIVDSEGLDVADGEPGELWVRGPNVMKGYYREPDLTKDVMRPGGWLNTGDVVRRESDGALFVVGRTKELIIRSGFNVYPAEVESALNSHPSIIQSAVVGRVVEEGNEEVVAFVELDNSRPVSTTELQSYLSQRLSPYKCPSQIVVVSALPAAATGKVLKGRLRREAQELYLSVSSVETGK